MRPEALATVGAYTLPLQIPQVGAGFYRALQVLFDRRRLQSDHMDK
jgi:hypothetical protein